MLHPALFQAKKVFVLAAAVLAAATLVAAANRSTIVTAGHCVHGMDHPQKWSTDHKGAGDACRTKLPLLPWGMDRDNPAYQDNMHKWVQCMNDKGMHVVEPWTRNVATQVDAGPPHAVTPDVAGV